MAADFIVVDKAKQMGNALVQVAELLRNLREAVDRVSDSMNHCINGGDYSLFETRSGIATGGGANAATLVGLLQNILNTSTDVTGASRLSQLDEFCSRLACQ